jgi:hypothetical protein
MEEIETGCVACVRTAEANKLGLVPGMSKHRLGDLRPTLESDVKLDPRVGRTRPLQLHAMNHQIGPVGRQDGEQAPHRLRIETLPIAVQALHAAPQVCGYLVDESKAGSTLADATSGQLARKFQLDIPFESHLTEKLAQARVVRVVTWKEELAIGKQDLKVLLHEISFGKRAWQSLQEQACHVPTIDSTHESCKYAPTERQSAAALLSPLTESIDRAEHGHADHRAGRRRDRCHHRLGIGQ